MYNYVSGYANKLKSIFVKLNFTVVNLGCLAKRAVDKCKEKQRAIIRKGEK